MEKQSLRGTPEHYLTVPGNSGPDIDAITCAITRAQAVVSLLACQYDDPDEPPQLPVESISAALWSLDGYLDQIRALCESSIPDDYINQSAPRVPNQGRE